MTDRFTYSWAIQPGDRFVSVPVSIPNGKDPTFSIKCVYDDQYIATFTIKQDR